MRFVETITEDNLILQGLLVEPPKKTDTVILHIHGMSGNFWENGFIKTMIEDYPKNNLAFLTVETRGSELQRWFFSPEGDMKLIGNSYEIFEECIYDIGAWVTFLQSQGYKKIHLQGHSLGCSKIAYYQKMKGNSMIKSILLISPSDMMGLLVEPKYKAEYEKFYKEAKELVKKGKENELLSGIHWSFSRMSAKSFINFSFENDNLAIFNYYNPERGFKTLSEIKVPILTILGTKDDGIVTDAYESTDMLKKHAKKSKEFNGVVFDGAQHDFKGFEKNIVKEVLKFIKN